MADNSIYGNALLAAVVKQRDQALNQQAQAEADLAMALTNVAELSAENEKLLSEKANEQHGEGE